MVRCSAVLLCVAAMTGCTEAFTQAVATGFAEGTLQSLPGVVAPGRYQVRLVSATLAKADFLNNDEPGAPELFVVVKHRGGVVLSTQVPRIITQDSFQVTFNNVLFELDWQRGDLVEIELWDEDVVSPDQLMRWVSTDHDAPLFAKGLTSPNGSKVVFTSVRTR